MNSSKPPGRGATIWVYSMLVLAVLSFVYPFLVPREPARLSPKPAVTERSVITFAPVTPTERIDWLEIDVHVFIFEGDPCYHYTSSCDSITGDPDTQGEPRIDEADSFGYVACDSCCYNIDYESLRAFSNFVPSAENTPTPTRAPVSGGSPFFRAEIMVWVNTTDNFHHRTSTCYPMENPTCIELSRAIRTGRKACLKCG